MCDDDTDCDPGLCEAMKCFPRVRSCLELYMLRPDLASAVYPLYPDLNGADPVALFCDMNPSSPGWTRVFFDDLDPGVLGVWDPLATSECGDNGQILGPYGQGDVLTLITDAQQVPHTELRVDATFLIMDSWDAFDNDQIIIRLSSEMIFNQVCDYQSSFACNQDVDLCNNIEYPDGLLPISTVPVDHDDDAIALEFTSTLNEWIQQESWGLDRAAVLIR